jgi:tRNA 2-selenouridine synthase
MRELWDLSLQAPSTTAVLDARSPSEFADDHLPNAYSLPVLNDDERALIGTTYKQDPVAAKYLGAPRVLSNIANHVTHLHASQFASSATTFRRAVAHCERVFPSATVSSIHRHTVPLLEENGVSHVVVYCARGGLRSRSLATVLQHVVPPGVTVSQLEGGYKEYRTFILEQCDTLFSDVVEPVVVSGPTGSGKTALLETMLSHPAKKMFSALDLEGLANHRGSIFGGFLTNRSQPSQSMFESRIVSCLAQQLHHQCQQQAHGMDKMRVFVEDESSKIGELCQVPKLLYGAMRSPEAVRVVLEVPLEARVQHLVDIYRDWILSAGESSQASDNDKQNENQAQQLDSALQVLFARFIKDREIQQALMDARQHNHWHDFVRLLLVHHYDRAYAKKEARKSKPQLVIPLTQVSAAEMERVALPLLQSFSPTTSS